MALRGTTVARHSKEIVVRERDHTQGERILCAWADCENYGVDAHKTVQNDAKPGFPPKLITFVFCSANCKHYFDTSHIPGQYGRLQGSALRSRYM